VALLMHSLAVVEFLGAFGQLLGVQPVALAELQHGAAWPTDSPCLPSLYAGLLRFIVRQWVSGRACGAARVGVGLGGGLHGCDCMAGPALRQTWPLGGLGHAAAFAGWAVCMQAHRLDLSALRQDGCAGSKAMPGCSGAPADTTLAATAAIAGARCPASNHLPPAPLPCTPPTHTASLLPQYEFGSSRSLRLRRWLAALDAPGCGAWPEVLRRYLLSSRHYLPVTGQELARGDYHGGWAGQLRARGSSCGGSKGGKGGARGLGGRMAWATLGAKLGLGHSGQHGAHLAMLGGPCTVVC
jgi:hypothetical protein